MEYESFGVRYMTKAELDDIAINKAGVVGVATQDILKNCPKIEMEFHGGYGFKWINTRGMSNRGKLILVPKNRRTYAIIRKSRIDRLVKEENISETLAAELVGQHIDTQALNGVLYLLDKLTLKSFDQVPKKVTVKWLKAKGMEVNCLAILGEVKLNQVFKLTKELILKGH